MMTYPSDPDYEWENELHRLKAKAAEERKSEAPTTSGRRGTKFDQGKQPWFAMPLEVLEPLADVFAAGEKKYSTFNCLQPFEDSSRRFYDGKMRHSKATQLNPLATDPELFEKYGIKVYEEAQVAFNALLRLYHARKEAGEI